MSLFTRSMGCFGPVFLAIAVQSALLSGPNVAPSQGAAVPEKPFATIVEPIGVAATPAGFGYVTRPFCASEADPTHQIVSFDSTGSVKVVAAIVGGALCRELYIAVTPGPADNTAVAGYPTPNPAGFTSNELYVADGGTIFVLRLKRNINGSVALNSDGSPQFLAPAVFAPVGESSFGAEGACGNSHTGITFDEVGTFGFRLIVTCNNGKVWSFDRAGNATLIATITGASGPFEGPVVTPCRPVERTCTGTFGGNLLVAAEAATVSCGTDMPFHLVQAALGAAALACPPNGEVIGVSPTGAFAPIANVPSAEGVTIVPTSTCTFGLTRGFTYFTAIFKPAGAAGPGGTVDGLPRSAFARLGGNALVASENGETGMGIVQVSSPGVVTNFRNFFAQHEGSAFADCLVPVLLDIEVIRPTGSGPIIVNIHSNSNFFAGNINPSTVLFGPYTTGPGQPPTSCVLPKGGQTDQESQSGAQHERFKGTATCTFPNNLAPGQLGVLKLKYNNPGGPGDGDAEGGG